MTSGKAAARVALDFGPAISVGRPSDLIELQRRAAGTSEQVSVPSSRVARGLSLKALQVTNSWNRLWTILGKRTKVYFLSVAFDVSGERPVVLPPKEVPEGAVYSVRPGESISFTLGDGLPIFPARVITGGLVVYLTICEADRGIRHVGEVMAQVHADLAREDSIVKVVKDFVKNPGRAGVNEILGAAAAALQPIATILKNNQDEYIALFSGIYPAKGPWADKLTATNNGTTIELAELR